MKNLLSLLLVLVLFNSLNISFAKEKVDVKKSEYSIQVTIKDIPSGQQTLFVPIKIDSMILDFDKVALEDLSSQNILAVASSSKDKVGTGIGLLKLDTKGLPESLTFKVYLKPTGVGKTNISPVKIADEPTLLSKGAVLFDLTTVNIASKNEIEVFEKEEKSQKRLTLSEPKLTLNIQRPAQKEETIFIPIIFDKSVIDLDETFGHAVVGPGIAAKSFSSGSLHEGGPGVEIRLSEAAEKDFLIDVDLVPRKIGKSVFNCAIPQSGHTALVRGPVVNINPNIINVAGAPEDPNVVISE